jgi:phosphoenolpyruvate synthase/pyruvate phosphate dikinase
MKFKTSTAAEVYLIGSVKEGIYNKLGGKGASIEKLYHYGFLVAPGIVISVEEFDRFIKYNHLEEKIKIPLDKDIYEEYSDRIINTILHSKLPEETVKAVEKALTEAGIAQKKLIVRSSANIEDNAKESFAGQFDTVIDVKPEEVKDAILRVYASLFNHRALRYMEHMNIDVSNIKMAVLIQEFIDTDFAGVTFTTDPVTGDKNKIIIEYVSGLGKELVSGSVEPTSVIIDKQNMKITGLRKSTKFSKEISEEEIKKVAQYAIEIEKIYNTSMDIEWGIKNEKVFIFQARPMTAIEESLVDSLGRNFEGYSTLLGIPASSGLGRGIVHIVNDRKELKNFKSGEVLVCEITYDNYLPDMLKASAIVTELGGITSHAAIVAREHKIPCVVGVVSAMSLLKNGEEVIVDASKGIIYHKGKEQNQRLPERALDVIIERAKPYRVISEKNGELVLKESTIHDQIRDPQSHILIENLEEGIVISKPKSIEITDRQIEDLKKQFNKPIFILEGDKYETYTVISFAIQTNKKFRMLFSELKKVVSSSEAIEKFSRKCLKEDIRHLKIAESLLKKKDLSLYEIGKILKYINDSAVYFTFINSLLTTGYGIEYVRNQFEKIQDKLKISFPEFIIKVDSNEIEALKKKLNYEDDSIRIFDNAVDVYKSIAKWKFESDKLDYWDKRTALWREASKIFKEKTGHDVYEFLKDQYGSGIKLNQFLRKGNLK